jgi:protease-4
MNTFFKVFFASLLALAVFSIISFFVVLGLISGITSSKDVSTGKKAVLMVDLTQNYPEIAVPNPLSAFGGGENYNVPSLYEVVRLIEKAKTDSSIKGIYINCGGNANDFGANDEIRNAIIDFKESKKFVYAYGDVISQNAYHVASVADKVYCNPHGGLDWRGFSMQMAYLKGTLEKLDIQPQIFYAGKFKSATEPFRETKMTEANKLQVTELLNDLYGHFIYKVAQSRNLDTASLRRYAVESLIQFPNDALRYKLVDGLKYDDEVRGELHSKLQVPVSEKINFISLGKYLEAVSIRKSGSSKIAVIYAAGNIIDGKGDRTQIGGETYQNLIRKVRLDKNIKAIVLRVNSGGGSALASENIWRELVLAKKEKPLVISLGDVAASGGYYIAAPGDSIFSQANTITGSIGVFALIPNMQKFFNNKIGITFDAVKTAPDADLGTITQPLTGNQQRFIQAGVDSIYHLFKSRVASGRKLEMNMVDSIGQGRVWSGKRAVQLGLVDRIGGLNDAIAAAAKMAKLTEFGLREYPEAQTVFEYFMGDTQESEKTKAIEKDLGSSGLKTYNTLKAVKEMVGVSQTRIPFQYFIQN